MVKLQDTNISSALTSTPCTLTDIVYVFTVSGSVRSIPTSPEAKVISGHERRPLVRLLVLARKGVGEHQTTLRVAEASPSYASVRCQIADAWDIQCGWD